MTDGLKQALEKSGQYRLVDLASIRKQIDGVKDIHDCNGCEIELAKQAERRSPWWHGRRRSAI